MKGWEFKRKMSIEDFTRFLQKLPDFNEDGDFWYVGKIQSGKNKGKNKVYSLSFQKVEITKEDGLYSLEFLRDKQDCDYAELYWEGLPFKKNVDYFFSKELAEESLQNGDK